MRAISKHSGQKRAFVFLVAVVALAIVAVIVVAALHASYAQKLRAEIVDFGAAVESGETGYVLHYESGVKAVDLSKEVTVNEGASLSVVKIKDEDGTVSKGNGTLVDVSVKPLRTATLRVFSENGQNAVDYVVTVAPKESENNRINYVTEGSKSGDFVYTYSGQSDVSLPTPEKIYTSPATGNEVAFPFEGWYTDPTYAEESKVDSIPQGTEGEVTLYAKFADSLIYGARDGYTYVYYGEMPQSRVTDYNLVRVLRNSSEYLAARNRPITFGMITLTGPWPSGQFTYNGNKYFFLRPNNVPNLSENGYSSSSYYFFKVEPIEWRVLKKKNETPASGNTVTLMSTCILGGGRYCENGGIVQNVYETYVNQNNFSMSGFENYFFDGNTMYHGGNAALMKYDGMRDTVKSLYDMMSFSNTSIIRSRSFSFYKNIFNGTDSFSDNLWIIDYNEALSVESGFSSDYKYNDPLRKAYCTDFAAAQGVFRSTERGTMNQGSWWLRGGSKRKTVAYVKYTGYVHRYTASNYALLSGIRPCMNVTYDTSVLTVSTRS
ncbi:MAG: hypothetical protein IJ735_05920 [Clostridia bacterium]|nr:hypothetical protein [Clostridia bacterium]